MSAHENSSPSEGHHGNLPSRSDWILLGMPTEVIQYWAIPRYCEASCDVHPPLKRSCLPWGFCPVGPVRNISPRGQPGGSITSSPLSFRSRRAATLPRANPILPQKMSLPLALAILLFWSLPIAYDLTDNRDICQSHLTVSFPHSD